MTAKYQPGKVIRTWENLHWALANQRCVYVCGKCRSTAFAANMCYASLNSHLALGRISWAVLKREPKQKPAEICEKTGEICEKI